MRGAILVLVAAVSMSGCASVGYLFHTASGHLDIVAARRPLDTVIDDPGTSPFLAARLVEVREAREFAARELALPAGGSFSHFVALDRDYPVWSVTAAPELSLTPRHWCYPLVGCLSYRGFFELERAAAEAAQLRREGFDVYVAPVQAYSTLGWFEDPVLSSLVRGPPWYTASVMFHELAHQRLYIPGDTAFNEAYAVAIQEEGERRWLAGRSAGERASWERYRSAREEFLALVWETRAELEVLYESERSDADKRAGKADALRRLRARYAAMAARLDGFRGFDRWFGQDLNNAKLALVATYNELVPRFAALIREHDGDMEAFHVAVAGLATLDPEARRRGLPLAP